MSKLKAQIGVATLAVLGLIGTAAAQGPPQRRQGGPGPGGPDGGGPGLQQLDLTDQQRDQIRAIHEKNREANRPTFEAARKAHQAFEKLLAKDGADAASGMRAFSAKNAATAKTALTNAFRALESFIR
jgi:Spy/CpxP family protein refolding chaperone